MTIIVTIAAMALLMVAVAQFVRLRAKRRLLRGGRVVQTSRGPVEYAVVGSGPPVVVLHGGAGGWDQGVALAVSLLAPTDQRDCVDYHHALAHGGELLRHRFTVIAPSRVGYLRTPLTTGRTPAEGADAVAALLDELGIGNAVVIGVSGGGPTALQFALRHPDRTSALVMVAAIARRHVQPSQTTESIAGRIIFARGFGWLLDLFYAAAILYGAIRPLSAAKHLLLATETLDKTGIRSRLETIRRHPDQLRWMRGLLQSGYPLSVRKTGLDNDLRQFAAIEDYPVARIACPTLVVHGRHDGNVPFDHAEFVASGVPNARLVVAETCGHLIWMSEEEKQIRKAVIDFATTHACA